MLDLYVESREEPPLEISEIQEKVKKNNVPHLSCGTFARHVAARFRSGSCAQSTIASISAIALGSVLGTGVEEALAGTGTETKLGSHVVVGE